MSAPAAAALAALIAEPIPSTSVATAETICGSVITYDVIRSYLPRDGVVSVERFHGPVGLFTQTGSGEQRAAQSVDVGRGDAGVAQVAVQ